MSIRNFGKHSYGKKCITIHTYGYGDENFYIDVGNFTSIAANCNILLSHGHHFHKKCTNFYFFDDRDYLFSNAIQQKTAGGGNVTIGSDVWIGRQVTIMSGVSIGDGAVIATNSHVISDVPPYSIYGGNPAKLIKYRFTQDIIDKFLNLKWWNYSDKMIDRLIPYLQKEPTLELFDKIHLCLEQNKNIAFQEDENFLMKKKDIRGEDIFKIYNKILKRNPDTRGFKNYYNSNLSIEQITNELLNSMEYKELIKKEII